ncbi:MAG: protein-L-isoaspartate O-methyltransferase [Rubellimicrobium sp.]|nr:protein-L-isoaspartate O-methyltransferase [Rubellimicrobium sp.]
MADYATLRNMMVDTQVRTQDVTRFPIIEAMLTVPREQFVPSALREIAYIGENLEIAAGRVLLDPRSFTKMLETLAIGPADSVLHVGAGMGYGTAVMARLAQFVAALESDEALAARADSALGEAGVDNAAVFRAALDAGVPSAGPYDAILIEGGVNLVPAAVLGQLKDGGRIAAIFMEGALGEMRLGVKRGSRVSWRSVFNATAPVLPGYRRARVFTL